jgi:hypothetical protein
MGYTAISIAHALVGQTVIKAMFWLTCFITALYRTGFRLNARGAISLLLGGVSLMCGTTLRAQDAVPSSWLGTWMLDVPRSTIGRPLMPGTPSGLTIIGQTLALDQTAQQLRLSGETNYSDARGTHSARETTRLNLDGTPTFVGPISLVFKRIDGSTFEINSELMLVNRRLSETSHFVIAADGQTLTETKTQIERSADSNGETEATTRTSTSVLVFHKRPNS